MQVNLYATLRPLAGGKTIQVPLAAPVTALAVLQAAMVNKPELSAEMWESRDVLKSHIKVFINGRQSVHLQQGLQTILREDDVLDVFPPVGGG
jgi:sulfur-carrier protein